MTCTKSLEKEKKELLGKSLETYYFVGNGSLRQYMNGWMIKPNKQDPVVITIKQGHLLARWLKNKNQLFTMNEAVRMYGEKIAEKI